MSLLADMPAVLTVEETAEVLRIGRSAAYAAVKAGDIPSIRVGRQIRVPRHLLDALLSAEGRGHSVDNGSDPQSLRGVSDARRSATSDAEADR